MSRYLPTGMDPFRGLQKGRAAEHPLMARINRLLWLLAAICFVFAAIVWWRLLG